MNAVVTTCMNTRRSNVGDLSFLSLFFKWYNNTDYPIFKQYQRYRRLHPQQLFYILHPSMEWQLWKQLQDNMAEPIQKNPPSSGLLGMQCSVLHLQYWRQERKKNLFTGYSLGTFLKITSVKALNYILVLDTEKSYIFVTSLKSIVKPTDFYSMPILPL